jgi:hypothetical protein
VIRAVALALLLLPAPATAQREHPTACLNCAEHVLVEPLQPGTAQARAALFAAAPSHVGAPTRLEAPVPATPSTGTCVRTALVVGAGTAVLGVAVTYLMGTVVDATFPPERDTPRPYLVAGSIGFGVGAVSALIYCHARV